MSDLLERLPEPPQSPEAVTPVAVPRRLVQLVWEDALHRPRGWSFTSEIDFEVRCICWSVGWLVEETDTHYCLAAAVGHATKGDPDQEQLGGVAMIPKRMVMHLRDLTEASIR